MVANKRYLLYALKYIFNKETLLSQTFVLLLKVGIYKNISNFGHIVFLSVSFSGGGFDTEGFSDLPHEALCFNAD